MAAEVRANLFRACPDEGDALNGGRSGLTDAHDRYANIEMRFPLPRVASLEGMAMLAANLRGDIDPGVRSFDA